MKKLLISLVVFSVLFIIGCQENSITDPVSTESINKNQTVGENITSGVIPLEGLLIVPGGFQTYYEIQGQINYTHELIFRDPMPPAPQYSIDLNLSVRANLTDGGHNTFRISSTSEDNFYVSEDGKNILEKSFIVNGTNDELALVCRFLVTTDGVVLNGKWLVVNSEIQLDKTGTGVIYPPVKINVYE